MRNDTKLNQSENQTTLRFFFLLLPPFFLKEEMTILFENEKRVYNIKIEISTVVKPPRLYPLSHPIASSFFFFMNLPSFSDFSWTTSSPFLHFVTTRWSLKINKRLFLSLCCFLKCNFWSQARRGNNIKNELKMA